MSNFARPGLVALRRCLALCVRDDAGAPAFQVADNGKGFDARPGWLGAGFPGMADRLGALEGSVRLESAPRPGRAVSGQCR